MRPPRFNVLQPERRCAPYRQNQNLDFFVFICHVPNPLGVDAAVGGRIVCDADIAARRFSAELILKGRNRTLLFGRRDFGKAVIAVDADGVIAESGAGEGSHAAARYGDEFARRRFTGKRLAGGLAGGYRARNRRARRPYTRSASGSIYRRRYRKRYSDRPCAAFWS